MENTEKDVTPVPPITEANKIWQEYLQKCCEVGQLMHTIDQLESQKLQFEKTLEVTQRAVKSLANKHKEITTNGANSTTPPPKAPEAVTEAVAH